jgi:hypothetical protein
MPNLSITTIDRNIGATHQYYRIEYKKPLDVTWTHGPTLSYEEAQPAPLGVLPVDIPLDPLVLMVDHLNVRIVTVCNVFDGEVDGDPQDIDITDAACTD